MSVPSSTSRIQAAANGSTTSFPFPYLVYAAAELIVLGVDSSTGNTTTYVLNTDYTIDPSELGQPGGVNVVFGTAPADTVTLTIARVVPYTQPVTLVEGAALPSVVLQRQMDETEFQIQQIVDQLNRTPSLPITAPVGAVVAPRYSNDYQAYDVSSGSTPQVSITPGNHRDSTGGTVWTPTVGAGDNITSNPPPILTLGSDDTVIYFVGTINASTGAISALDIEPGTSVPSDTSTAFYQLLTNVAVTITDGVARVAILGGGVSGSQNYFYCGQLPATNGSGHLLNS